jgi:pimeloyl-ACP methyl ester carboxylesterase
MPTATVRDLSMAYELGGSGTPLVLVAGTGYPGATWPETLLAPLREHHRVLTFDHRGTGGTPSGADPFSTRVFASDAIALMDALDLPAAHVVGHSMGGRVAQWMTLDSPERVRTLVLAASGPGQFDPAKPVTRGVPLHTAVAMIESGYDLYMAEHIRDTFFTPEFAASEPDRVAWLVRAFWEHRPGLEAYLRHVIARQEHQTADRLADIAVPTLVLIGDRDRHAGGTGVHWEQSQYLFDHIPGAERRVVEGASHGYFWELPEVSARMLLEWTAAHDG